jgi:O-antigen ligase
MTLICLAATIMTGSRAGGLATFVALLAMTAALTLRSVATLRARVLVSLSLICVFALLALLFGGGNLADRLQEGFSEDGRAQVWSAIVTATRSNFWFGTGLGTFTEIFPSIRTEAVGYEGIWERAHSTPAELALTLGVPLTALILLAWVWLIWAHLRAAISARQSYTLPTLGCAALLLASLHGSVDFSLQIPGFVIPFAVLVGTTLGYGVRRSIIRRGDNVRFGEP